MDKLYDYIPEAQLAAIAASELFRCCLMIPTIFILAGTQGSDGDITVTSSEPIIELECPMAMTVEQQAWLTDKGGHGGYTLEEYRIVKYQNVTSV